MQFYGKKQPGWGTSNLKDAQCENKKDTVIEKSLFQMPETNSHAGTGEKYYLRTYGCQANEREQKPWVEF